MRCLPCDLQSLHDQQRRREGDHDERRQHDQRIQQQARSHAEALHIAAETEDQHQRGQDVDDQRDIGDRRDAALEGAEGAGHDIGLEEVRHRVDPGHQQDEGGLLARIGRLEQLAKAVQRLAGQLGIEARALRLLATRAQALLLAHQQVDDPDHQEKACRGDEQQAVEAGRLRGQMSHEGTCDRPDAAARGDEGEHPRGLARGERIHHQRPEH